MRLFRRHADRPMGCEEVGRVLQDYLDGVLDDRRARRLAAHLEDCRRCGLEAEIYEHIKASLVHRRAHDLPLDALERLTDFAHDLVRSDGPTVR